MDHGLAGFAVEGFLELGHVGDYAVDAGEAASTAGLHVGDRVIELDGAAVSQLSPRELMYLVWTHASGTMRVGVDRGGTNLTVAIAIR